MKFIPQQPFVLPYADRRSDTAVLFLHGITEGPDQFRRPAAWANDLGFDAAATVLPGHGGSAGTFARSGREEWEAFVHSLTDEYRLRYPPHHPFPLSTRRCRGTPGDLPCVLPKPAGRTLRPSW